MLNGQEQPSRSIDLRDRSLGVTTAITSDQDGFVWLSTSQGLVRYDGTNFIPVFDLVRNIPELPIRLHCLFVDSRNILWIYKSDFGLGSIDLQTYQWQKHDAVPPQRGTSFYYSIHENEDGDIFLPHPKGCTIYRRVQDSFDVKEWEGLEQGARFLVGIPGLKDVIVGTSDQVFRYHPDTDVLQPLPGLQLENGIIADIEMDAYGKLWLSNWYSGLAGLIRYDLDSNRISQIFSSEVNGPNYITSTDIWQILPDDQGVYLATNSAGLWFYDYARAQMFKMKRHLARFENDNDQARAVHRDLFGRLWIGGSVDVYREVLYPKSMDHLSTNSATPLPSNNLFTVAALDEKQLAFGSDQGLSIFDMHTGRLASRQFPFYNGNRYNNQVNHVFIYEGHLWAGTWSSLVKLDEELQTIERYITFRNAGQNHPAQELRGEIGAVMRSAVDSEGSLWILNSAEQIVCISGAPHARQSAVYTPGPAEERVPYRSLIHHPSLGILATTPSKLWQYIDDIGAFQSLEVFDSSQLVAHQNTQLHLGVDQQLYLLNGSTMFRIDAKTLKATRLGDATDVTDLDNLIVDGEGIAWMTAQDGAARWDLRSGSIMHLDADLFLFSGAFNRLINVHKSALTNDGVLCFASNNGAAYLDTRLFQINTAAPELRWTSLKSHGESVIDGPLHQQKTIVLPYAYNDLHLGYSILNDAEPTTRLFSYRLDQTDEWVDLGSQTSLSLLGLAPGNFFIELTATTGDGSHSITPLTLGLTIRPPWYRSTFAYLSYLMLAMTIGYAFYRARLTSFLAKQEASRIHELSTFKNQFFTNISHEFRTPLTVIQGMANKIAQNADEWAPRGSRLIKRNSQTLLGLINQILELGKLEQGMLKRKLVQGDIVAFLRYLCANFRSYAEDQGQEIVFKSDHPRLVMDYDEHHIQRICTNLISNAIKYSDEPGRITFRVLDLPDSLEKKLIFEVEDQGVGIQSEQIAHVFDRFYRASEGTEIGTGVGLALTQELVLLAGGTIEVNSEVGVGSTFRVVLPFQRSAETTPSSFHPTDLESEIAATKSATPSIQEGPLVLLVEDNNDVAEYVRITLEDSYQVVRAANGKVGFEQACERIPDVIISDIMMPIMSGLEMISQIRSDARVDHIPVILLTAKADVMDRIDGFGSGADAYLAKPFEERELLAILKRMILQRDLWKKRFASVAPASQPLSAGSPTNHKADQFLERLSKIIRDHLQDSTFGVPELAVEVNLSGRQLTRKMSAICDLTPNQLIRHLRIERAKELLLQEDKNISEVSWEVGFSSAQYFATVFKKEVGVSPKIFAGGDTHVGRS